MHTIVYVVWISIPTVMVCLVLWDLVDNLSKRKKHKHFFQHLRQVAFVTVAILACVGVDRFFLDTLIQLPFLDWIGRDLFLVLLLPLALFLGALVLGPTKPILISEAPKLGRKK